MRLQAVRFALTGARASGKIRMGALSGHEVIWEAVPWMRPGREPGRIPIRSE